MALRRGGRTCVELTCDGSPATSAALWALSTHFGGAVAAVSDLKVVTTAHYPHNTVEGFVRFAAPMLFPNLNTLTLIGDAHPLPPPAQLPRLAAVAVSCVPLAEGRLDAMVTSFAPYLPQLTVLHVSKVGGPAVTWGPLFTPSNKSQALRVFSTSERLSEQLLSGLLSHAPALKQLSVGSLAGAGPMGIRDHSKESWAVEQLHVGDLTGQASAGCVATLMRLPRSTAAGRVQVTTGDGWTLMPLTAQVWYASCLVLSTQVMQVNTQVMHAHQRRYMPLRSPMHGRSKLSCFCTSLTLHVGVMSRCMHAGSLQVCFRQATRV